MFLLGIFGILCLFGISLGKTAPPPDKMSGFTRRLHDYCYDTGVCGHTIENLTHRQVEENNRCGPYCLDAPDQEVECHGLTMKCSVDSGWGEMVIQSFGPHQLVPVLAVYYKNDDLPAANHPSEIFRGMRSIKSNIPRLSHRERRINTAKFCRDPVMCEKKPPRSIGGGVSLVTGGFSTINMEKPIPNAVVIDLDKLCVRK